MCERGWASMSALPPIADIGTQSCDVCFVPKADSCTATTGCLFDHLVGEREHIVGDFYAKRFCGVEIENKRKLGRLFDWQVGRFGTFQYLVNVASGAPIQVRIFRPIGH